MRTVTLRTERREEQWRRRGGRAENEDSEQRTGLSPVTEDEEKTLAAGSWVAV